MQTVAVESYLPRIADRLISRLHAEFPALLVVGPRAVGKTTTAARRSTTILRLDRPAEAAVVEADPDAAIRRAEPVLIDEWQRAPSVLGAVKRAVDDDPRPGRFIVTGSVNAELEQQTWPGTGRLLRIDMAGLTVREMVGGDLSLPAFLDRLVEGDTGDLQPAGDPPDLRGYVEFAVRGGFPEAALHRTDSGRSEWARSYLGQLFTRDVDQLDGRRDPNRLRRFFEAYAVTTAGVVVEKTLFDAAGINRKTADSYERLLQNLYVVDAVPAWHTNRLKRLVRLPKRYVVDSGLVSGALGLGVDGFMSDGDLLGRLLDTFVVAQLRAELQASSYQPRLYHLRDQNGDREVDILIELDVNRLVAIEIKASSAPTARDARHLRWLRDQLGDRFVVGAVLHTGPRAFRLDERILAVPICSLWS